MPAIKEKKQTETVATEPVKRKYTKKADKQAEVEQAAQVAPKVKEAPKADSKPAIKNLPAKPEIKVQVLARVSDAPVTLADIETDINKHLDNVASSAMRVGGLLIIAKDFHESTEKFLKWTEDKFSIKKAQVYKLMKVHQEFGQDERFDGVAMRVMNMLTGQPAEVVQKAAELASAGKLDSKAAEMLTKRPVDISPVLKAPAALAPPVEIEEAEIVDLDSSLPFDTGASVTQPAKVAPAAPQSATGPSVESLLAQIADLTRTIEELTKPKQAKVQAMPMLKQFTKGLPCIVLGLDDNEATDPKQVRAAYRELAAIWNKDSNAEAFNLITAARDALLNG